MLAIATAFSVASNSASNLSKVSTIFSSRLFLDTVVLPSLQNCYAIIRPFFLLNFGKRRIPVPNMSPAFLIINLLLATFITVVLSSNVVARQSCSSGYTLCSPPGATGSGIYDTGDGLVHLFFNILDTIKPQSSAPSTGPQSINPNGPAKRQSVTTMCCRCI